MTGNLLAHPQQPLLSWASDLHWACCFSGNICHKVIRQVHTIGLVQFSHISFALLDFSLKKFQFKHRFEAGDVVMRTEQRWFVYWHGIGSRRLVSSRRQGGSENLNILTCSQPGKWTHTRSQRTKQTEEAFLRAAKLVFPQVEHAGFYTWHMKNKHLWCESRILAAVIIQN